MDTSEELVIGGDTSSWATRNAFIKTVTKKGGKWYLGIFARLFEVHVGGGLGFNHSVVRILIQMEVVSYLARRNTGICQL